MARNSSLESLLDGLTDAEIAAGRDDNLSWLRSRLAGGFVAQSVSRPRRGLYDEPGAWVVVTLGRGAVRERIPLGIGRKAAAFLRRKLADVPVDEASSASSRPAVEPMLEELRTLFVKTSDRPHDERARELTDWMLERLDASRCALVPIDAGTIGPPISFRMRGQTPPADVDLRQVPRRAIEHVLRTRQAVASIDVRSPGGPVSPSDSMKHQQVGSFMAVPVVFHGELIAVCYLDRYDRPGSFSPEDQASFSALAYELASPLLLLRDQRRGEEYRQLRDSLIADGESDPEGITSPALDRVLDAARRLAPHREENLLVLGETGVGKEVIARLTHRLSGRERRPFVAVNVSAVSAELFQSEFMGSRRGAFTGAVDRPGWIAEAEGGTLFLDEIGDLSLANQVRLLRLLQDKKFSPVGGREVRQADVRIVAATNRPLEQLIARGDFRDDLLHRFAPPLRVPPLRERKEEIVPRARAWLVAKARQKGLPVANLTREAEEYLLGYSWPGNVRQLEMVLSHALLLARGRRIDRPQLHSLCQPSTEAAPRTASASTWSGWIEGRDAEERRWLSAALERAGGKVATAARALGCSRSTLRGLLRRHGLDPDSSAAAKTGRG